MKTLLLIVVALSLTSCTSGVKQPTPFKTGEAIQLYGCEQLKKEVEAYNKTHSDKKVADC